MIVYFKHKGLKKLYEKDQSKAINPQWLERIRLILARLDASSKPEDMDLPGLNLHNLSGKLNGFHSVTVSKNWRIIFQFIDGNASNIDLID